MLTVPRSSRSRRVPMSTQIPLDEALRRLTDHVVAQRGSIKSTEIGKLYTSAGSDGLALKAAFKAAGGLKAAIAQCDALVYEHDNVVITGRHVHLTGTVDMNRGSQRLPAQPSLADAVKRLETHVVRAGGSISVTSGMDGFYRSLADDGPVLKLLFQEAGGVTQALKKCSSILTYEHNKDNNSGQIVAAATTTTATEQQEASPSPQTSGAAARKAKATEPARPSQASTPDIQLNASGAPLRPGTGVCKFWMKTGKCGYGTEPSR